MGKWNVLVLSVLLGACGAASAAGEAPTREDLQRALKRLEAETHEHFDHPRSRRVEDFIARGHGQVEVLARTAPDTRRIARIIFRKGLTARRLDALAREFRLQVHAVGMVFVREGVPDFENTLPSQHIWRSQEPLPAIIDQFVADNRKAFAAHAEQMRQESNVNLVRRGEYFDSMAKKSVVMLTDMQVTSAADMLRLVSGEAEVYAVVMNPSAESARRLEETRRMLTSPTSIQDVTDL